MARQAYVWTGSAWDEIVGLGGPAGVKGDTGDTGPTGPTGPSGLIQTIIPMTHSGTLIVGTGKSRFYLEQTCYIVKIRASVSTAPTGADAIVDVNKNGTTVFTTQSNRPTISADGFTSGAVTNMNVTALTSGDYLTVDIDQVGSTVAGSNLVVTIWIEV